MPRDPKDLGIRFRGDMVAAILAGQKRVTRRAMKLSPDWDRPNVALVEVSPTVWSAAPVAGLSTIDWPCWMMRGDAPPRVACRYTPGRRLWVRETWRPWVRAWSTHVQYRADGRRGPSLGAAESDACMAIAETNGGHWDDGRCQNPDTVKWRPSLLMPRWASRLTLRVTGVRAERLTEITDEDVALEGFEHAGLGTTAACFVREYRKMHKLDADADPWVWRIAFEVVDA